MERLFEYVSIYRITIYSIILLFCFTTVTYAKNYTLEWNANPEIDIKGYKFFYKADSSGQPAGDYDIEVDVGKVTTYIVEGLDAGRIYFFALKTYDGLDQESDFSSEVGTVSITSHSNGFYVNTSEITLEGYAEAGSDVEIYNDTNLLDTVAADETGFWTAVLNVDSLGVLEGDLSLKVISVNGGFESPVVTGIYDKTSSAQVTNLSGTSHTTSVWSNDNTVDLTWTAATDTGGSGLDGYSIEWDTTADTTPDTTKDIEEVTTASSDALPDGDSHYFHIRAVDAAGNWGDTEHYGPFYIDTTAPSSSATALDYGNGTFSLSWTASDETSGVASTQLWYKGPSGTWANSGLVAQAGTSGTFSYSLTGEEKVEAGTYYFATRSTDNAGNVQDEPSGEGDISYIITSPEPTPTPAPSGDGDGGRCFIGTAAF